MFHFKSISTRLIFYVTLSVLALFTVIGGILLFVQYLLATGLFMITTSWHVDSKAAEVEKRLVEVQSTILAHDVKVMNNIESEKRLAAVFQDILYNDKIFACGIALKPDSLTGERRLYYACRDANGATVVTRRPGDYAYEERDYFKETEARMTAYWSDPYLDDTLRVATFSHPLLDHDGRFVGVLCADVLLDSIADYITTDPGTSNSDLVDAAINKLCDGAMSFIISRNGFFIIPPDSTVTFNDTYETYALRHESPEFKNIAESMVMRDGKSEGSFNAFIIDEKEYLIAYSYITKVGWTVATMYPTSYIDGFLTGFCIVILVFLILGVLLLTWIIYIIVRRITRPLRHFIKATEAMAGGNFDIELPEVRHNSEVKILRDSFDEMRLSLKDYMTRLKDTTAENERMEQELDIAGLIQMSMLPKSFPKPPGTPEVSIFAFMNPAREVGGDLYDYFIRSGHLHFIIADVSGKGMPAAMIMAVTTSMFRALQRRDVTPQKTVKALNNMLLERNSAGMFVTLIVGDLDLATGELSMCNAGHTPPFIIERVEESCERQTDGSHQSFAIKRIDMQTNLPIGVFENYNYRSDSFTLGRDMRLLLYTDGVTEAANADDAMYGEERLAAIIRRFGSEDVETFANAIAADIAAFTGETPQSDDITMMVLEYHGSPNIVTREMSFSNEMSEVTRATALIEDVCEQLQVDAAIASSLQLALEEAMVNVITYAYENGRANIDNHFKITSDGKSITFILSDSGMPFDPTAAELPDTTLGIEERGVGGLGILLVKKIMDEVVYHRDDDRNILIMKKII